MNKQNYIQNKKEKNQPSIKKAIFKQNKSKNKKKKAQKSCLTIWKNILILLCETVFYSAFSQVYLFQTNKGCAEFVPNVHWRARMIHQTHLPVGSSLSLSRK